MANTLMIVNVDVPVPTPVWYLSGGIPSANCLFAYQPKGAASYTASRINIANPGTYDCTTMEYPVGWDTDSGWIFPHNGKSVLDIPWTPISGNKYSMIFRFSNGTNNAFTTLDIIFAGGRNTSTNSRFYISPCYSSGGEKHVYGWSDSQVIIAGYVTSGVMCNAAGKAYLDGEYEGGSETALEATGYEAGIGCQYQGDDHTSAASWVSAHVKALAVYNVALSETQVVALTSAMNTL